MDALESLLGAALHVLVTLPTALLLGLSAGAIAEGRRAPWWVLALTGVVLVALLALHVTAIVRPREHRWRRGAVTRSTSAAHHAADACAASWGAYLLWHELTWPGAPTSPYLVGWGGAHLALGAGLIALRWRFRERV